MAIAKFKTGQLPTTPGGGGGLRFSPRTFHRPTDGKVTRFHAVGNDQFWSRSAQWSFQNRLKGAFGALSRAAALATAGLAHELGKIEWATTTWSPTVTGYPLPRFAGFDLACDHTGMPSCGAVGNVRWSGEVGYPTFACFHPAYHCGNHAFLELAPGDVGATRQLSMHWETALGSSSVRAIWTAPTPTVAVPLGYTVPMEAPRSAEVPQPGFMPRPVPYSLPWARPSPWERTHPLADYVPAIRWTFPRAAARPGALPQRQLRPSNSRTQRHYQRPDGARKGRGLPKGMMRAMNLFHTATELKDFVDAVYDAMVDRAPITNRPDKTSGFLGRIGEIAQHWSALLDPVVAQEAVKNLLENEVEDRVIGRLFGGSWMLGRAGLRDNYASSSWVDAAGNDPYGNRDTVVGIEGSPTEVLPWN